MPWLYLPFPVGWLTIWGIVFPQNCPSWTLRQCKHNRDDGDGGDLLTAGVSVGLAGNVNGSEDAEVVAIDERPWPIPQPNRKALQDCFIDLSLDISEMAMEKCMQWVNRKILEYIGFQGITVEYLANVGQTFCFYLDKYLNMMTLDLEKAIAYCTHGALGKPSSHKVAQNRVVYSVGECSAFPVVIHPALEDPEVLIFDKPSHLVPQGIVRPKTVFWSNPNHESRVERHPIIPRVSTCWHLKMPTQDTLPEGVLFGTAQKQSSVIEQTVGPNSNLALVWAGQSAPDSKLETVNSIGTSLTPYLHSWSSIFISDGNEGGRECMQYGVGQVFRPQAPAPHQ
ncbi:hypothetical protein H4582DRAFT_2051940 [Lactarius indigo]|nr:hypothetical protein H4582DRAFT_2051940 [Lactarius indigo]